MVVKKLERILLSDDVVESIIYNLDDLLKIIPEINDMIDFPHNHPHHFLNVWNHTLFALSLSEKDFDIRLCLLLHDIGKPRSYQDREVRHFKGHPLVSSNMSRIILNRLGYSKEYIEEMCYLIENHDTPITLQDIENNYELEVKRFLIQYCDAFAHNPNKLNKRIKYLKETLELLSQYEINASNILKSKIKSIDI